MKILHLKLKLTSKFVSFDPCFWYTLRISLTSYKCLSGQGVDNRHLSFKPTFKVDHHRIIDDRMEYSIIERQIVHNLHYLEDAPGLYRPSPPSLHSYIGWLQNFCFRNFVKFLISCFAKFASNFAKFKIIL